ncbi:MAG TPA: hypothetical protein VEK77_14355 [Gemmatimonadales bacterium]|nr:hypothetical protein [Gemmatimonadales bacterium]
MTPALLLLLWGLPAVGQTPAASDYRLVRDTNGFALQSSAGSRATRIRVPRAWLVPRAQERAEEEAYVTSFAFDSVVSAFPIGNGLLGLHFSSYTLGGGSSMAAAGRDVFLILDPDEGKLTKGLVDLGVTQGRLRVMGCLTAHTSHFLIADVNRDGKLDIGRVVEEIDCEYERDERGEIEERRTDPYYRRSPVRWYVFSGRSWVLQPGFDGTLPESYDDLQLIGRDLNSVDFFAQFLWHSYDPAKWASRDAATPCAPFMPTYRKQLIARAEVHPQ